MGVIAGLRVCWWNRLAVASRFRASNRGLSTSSVLRSFSRFSTMGYGTESKAKGLVLGVYNANDGSPLQLTPVAASFDTSVNGRLSTLLKQYSLTKDVKQRLFYDLHQDFTHISVVDIGPKSAAFNALEEYDEKKENIRKAVATGVRVVADAGASEVFVDPCDDEESVAEAVNLVTFRYDELKSDSSKKPKVHVSLFGEKTGPWNLGFIKADAQNFVRYLMETPANHLEPSHFVQKVAHKVKDLYIQLIIREKKWAEQQGMGAFLSVSHGSHVAPLLLEMHYNGANAADQPIVFVGKGITFDSGGISLKSAANMDKMRADMGGAAIVASTIYAAASLNLKLNLRGIIPLTENMPGGGATKPGDVVFAMNKKSIQVDNTDAEGRLILADGLCYAQTFKPKFIVDLATLTGAMCVALGAGATGVFSNDTALFNLLHKAGSYTGDRVWRMPLFEYYSKRMKKCDLADLNNISGKSYGGSCTAAAFLREFVGDNKWMHIDIAGVMENEDDVPYMSKGMAGRPTRTMIEFLRMVEKSG